MMKRYLLVVILAFTVILSGCDLIGDYVDIDDLPDEIITETGVFEVGTTEPDWDLVMTALATLEGDTGGTIEFDSSTVDMDVVGVYVVDYTYTDSDDVVTEGSVTITIEDTTVPVITLQGSDNISIEVGTEFIDEGVTILDNYDLGLSIVVSGSVDVDTLGEYTLSYDVTDSNGNVALTVTRTVSVVDPAVPIITLNGEGAITLEVHSEFIDDGVLITDDVDVDMVPVITGVVDTTNIGEYILTYDYTDSDLNVAISVSRVVTIVDTTIPVITITGDSEITIEVGTDYIDEGALVIDNYDTDVTVVVTSDVDGLVLGQYTVAYNFTDSSLNQAVTEERIVNIVDTTIPVITLIGDETIYLECGVDYVEQGVTIVDNYDAGLVAVVTGEVDTEVLGEVTLTYDVTDSNGNVADTVTRTVIVEDTIAPVITLIGEVDFTLEYGTDYVEAGANIFDSVDSNLVVVITGEVDTEALNEYVLTYNVTDLSSNVATTVTRTVTVVDTTPPEITLNGEQNIYLEYGEEYIEQSVGAIDLRDTEIVVIYDNTHVDSNILGVYEILYSAVDDLGNQSQVTRYVHVVDTTPPVISLVGETEINIFIGEYYLDEYILFSDNYDTTYEVIIDGTIDFFNKGIYQVNYSVVDSSGNESNIVTRTVSITEVSETFDSEDFVKTYSFNTSSILKDVVEETNGDLVYAGQSEQNGLVFKTNKFGEVQWSFSTYQDYYADVYCNSIIIDSEGNYVVAGYMNTAESSIGFIVKLDVDGNLITRYDDSSGIFRGFLKIIETEDGDYLVSGYETYDYMRTILFSKTFEEIWSTQTDLMNQWVIDIIETDTNTFLVYSVSMWGGQFNIIEFDADGVELGYIYYSAPSGSSKFRDVIEDSDSNIVAVYYDYNNDVGKLVKYTEEETIFIIVDGPDFKVIPESVIELPNGHYLVVGEKYSDGLDNTDAIILEYDNDLVLIQYRVLVGSKEDSFYHLEQLADGRIIALGFTNSNDGDYEFGEIYGDGFVMKIDPDFNSALNEDDVAPVINLIGDSVINIENGTNYIELGVAITDNIDIDLEAIVQGTVDTSINGIYYIYYFTEDSSGNMAFTRRTVSVYSAIDETNEYVIDLQLMRLQSVDVYNNIEHLDTDNNGLLSWDETSQLTDFHAWYGDIVDISFLEYFPNITSLELSGNKIEDISVFEYLTKLEVVNLGSNDIVDISVFTNMASIQKLILYNNKITDVSPLDGMTGLIELHLSGNPILTLTPMGSLDNLEILYVSQTPATEFLNINRYSKLITLNISWNELTTISGLSGLLDLEYFDIYDNKISDSSMFAGIEESTKLTSVSVGQNELSDICVFSENIALIEFRFESNSGIEDISCLDKLVNLESMVLVNTNITDASVLANMVLLEYVGLTDYRLTNIDVLLDLPNLSSVYLNANVLDLAAGSDARYVIETILDRGVEVQIEDVIRFSNIDSALADELLQYDLDNSMGLSITETNLVTSITLNGMGIEDIIPLKYLKNLTYLDLYNNNIVDVDSLEHLTNLQHINLELNNISDISMLSALANLTFLEISWNSITDISVVANFTLLEDFDVKHNEISDITPIAGLTGLKFLNIQDTLTSDISMFNDLVLLEVFEITHNTITDISVLANFPNLRIFQAGENSITDISVLTSLVNLTTIVLQSNSISDISALSNCVGLRYVFLTDNLIDDLSAIELLPNLLSVYIYENSLDLTEGSDDMIIIDNLIDSGVNVYYENE